MSDLKTLKTIIRLMTDNKLTTVKFGDIEVVKHLHTDPTPTGISNLPASFDDLDEDEQLFEPTKGIGNKK